MNILIVNDDGISSPGIHVLAEHAKAFGNVTVVAPDSQCSAMSQKLTIFEEITIKKQSDYTVNNVEAYSVSGTPADCVKLAVQVIMKEKPDIVFSGINRGYNMGKDIAYSGTIGAAFEALQLGIPSIAFSTSYHSDYEVINKELPLIISELLDTPISKRELFNVNFPNCSLSEYQGIKRDLPLAQTQYYLDRYVTTIADDSTIIVKTDPIQCGEISAETDIGAVKNKYTSISKISNPVLI